MPKQKYYVVWKGRKTGIFTTWAECEKQVKGVVGAQFKAFDSDAEAEAAYLANYNDCLLYTSPSPRDRTRSRMPSSA